MAEITKDQIEAAYEYGKKVDTGELNVLKAAKEVSQQTQMVESSAQMYIQAVACMLKGKVYQRTINQEATEYYLKSISEELGEDALKLAISSVEQFIDYSENKLGGGRPSLKTLVKKYRGNKRNSYWILQGNPSRWDIDNYLKSNDLVYWGIQKSNHREQMEIGDRVFFWRAKGNSNGPYGIVAMGRVVERPARLEEIKYPEHVITSDEDVDKLRAGIQIEELRLTPEVGMVEVNGIKNKESLQNMQLLKARQGSSFLLTEEQFKTILEMWNNKTADQKNSGNITMYTSQSLNEYIEKIGTKYHLVAHEGRFLEFWSDHSRTASRFLIGYKQIADGLQTLIDSDLDISSFQTNHEQTWRDMSKIQGKTPVFQSFLTVQTSALFHVISQIIHWANNDPSSNYKDREVSLSIERIKKATNALQALHVEGHNSSYSAQIESLPPAGDGENLIVYGAPGSGKSYYIDKKTSETKTVRTVFHPEYQNSDFVGGLRPHKEDGQITYSFVPGPFVNALLLATKNKDEHVYLIIEEINRANAAAVFGDIFQLLDRNENNYSEYKVTPEETLKKYLEDQEYPTPSELRIPSNLSIMATMNSSDQGVFLLDSAFKRRWGFKYCPIDFKEHSSKKSFASKVVPYKGSTFSWSDFASVINNTLKRKEIEEDRLIGPYFLTEKERGNINACKQAIAGKLLIYLWDDVLRHGLRDQLFSSKISTFSDLVNAYDSNKPIFTDKVEELLEEELEDSSVHPETETLGQAGS